MKKVTIDVQIEKKVDNRTNNTGRPVNTKSARQVRLRKQALYSKLNKLFVSGKKFKINNGIYAYNAGDEGSMGSITNAVGMYVCGDKVNTHGYITSAVGGHVCNVSYIGRTKVLGYTFVLGRKINVEINLKQVTF